MSVFESSTLTIQRPRRSLASGLRHGRLRLLLLGTRDPYDPTSPRREASLFDSPGLFGPAFFCADLFARWSCPVPVGRIADCKSRNFSLNSIPMFSEVRQALLPIALRNLKRRGDLERAGLLIESLARHWRDSKPFELLIVAPARDVSLLRSSLPRFPRIEVSVRAESDFFGRFSRFWAMTGWYRQQIVKLEVPAQLGFGGFLTLDSDVCCVGDFDSRT